MKRHPLDPISLVFGLLFAAAGLAFVVARIDIASAELRWIWPLPLLALGGVMIALGARRSDQTRANGLPNGDASEDPESIRR